MKIYSTWTMQRNVTQSISFDSVGSEIEQNGESKVEPKTWTMHGEITADKRPKNSALEVDLDFEHNIRPTPVITEEFTASLEEIIQKRVLEIFRGLAYMHSVAGVCHRDLKPQNVLVDPVTQHCGNN